MPTKPSKDLDTFPNPHPERDYIISIETPEFTCLCPKTGQPDFATLRLEYVPDRLCVELKSLKLYFWSYRDEGAFHEKVTNTILNDLVTTIKPRYMKLAARFNIRGGIYTTVEAEHRQPGWAPPPPPPDHLPRINQELPGRTPVSFPDPVARVEAIPMETTATTDDSTPALGQSGRFRMLRRSRQPLPDMKKRPGMQMGDKAKAPDLPVGPERTDPVYLGIDLGSTGCRVIAVDPQGEMLDHTESPIPAPLMSGDQITQDPTQWWKAVSASLAHMFKELDPKRVHSIAVNGTSATVLLCDKKGAPVTPAVMYNDRRAVDQANRIAAVATPESGAQGATSSLAKLLWLQDKKIDKRAAFFLHQADWISGQLTGVYGHSDYNNCLKLGYDAQKMDWLPWLSSLGVNTSLLPSVHTPGDILGNISAETAVAFGLLPDTQVIAGTTDGVAAFLASGANLPGHGVTSLGSTLVLKLLSNDPVFSPEHGVYSHRLGKYWLAGGASNTGGSVLLQYFKVEQMREMTPLLDPDNPTGLEYYPLPDIGERFPINDPEMSPRLEPLPSDSVTFFQGMLEGIARIEAQGYELLRELGAPTVTAVWTTGGGSQNPAWTRIRELNLEVKMNRARSEHAAYGTALLAAGVVAKAFQ